MTCPCSASHATSPSIPPYQPPHACSRFTELLPMLSDQIFFRISKPQWNSLKACLPEQPSQASSDWGLLWYLALFNFRCLWALSLYFEFLSPFPALTHASAPEPVSPGGIPQAASQSPLINSHDFLRPLTIPSPTFSSYRWENSVIYILKFYMLNLIIETLYK